MTMRGKEDLSMGYWNPEGKLGVAGRFFFRNNKVTIILKSSKMQSNVWRFYPNLSFINSENAWLPPISLLDTKSTC